MCVEYLAIQNDAVLKSLLRRLPTKLLENPVTLCVEFQGKARANGGYGMISSSREFGPLRVHRLVWVLNNGRISDDLVVMHSCDNPLCCNIHHLSLGTRDDNMKDMCRKNRHFSPFKGRVGESSYNATISDKTAAEIWLATGSKTKIATLFDVTYKVVCDIKYRKTWTHVTDLLNTETENGLDY